MSFPILVMWRSGETSGFVSGYGRDLSLSGLRVKGDPPRQGATVDLQLVERTGRRPLEVLGEVTRVDEDGFAVRFVELEQTHLEWLTAAIRQADRAPTYETEDLMAGGFDEF